ncbi:MAG: DNA-directed RNA polymerase subunit H [Nanoarchaeales archaeon]|nr:DNA-directed RNA polymerase subunit H [Nanoarchaeales archaeon]
MGQQINFLKVDHRKISDDEVKAILEKYSLSGVLKLPRIKFKDKGLVDLEDISLGDVIEISRQSFAGESKYYRVVVE